MRTILRPKSILGLAALALCLSFSSCYSLPNIERPSSVEVSHVHQANIRTERSAASMKQFEDFLKQRPDGWQHWRWNYFGPKVAHPYVTLVARDSGGKGMYSLGVDEKYITFSKRNPFSDDSISLRRRATRAEHDELLRIVRAPDSLLDKIVGDISATYDLIVPVRYAFARHLADVGRYPTTSEGMRALVRDSGAAGWAGPYLNSIPRDTWGRKMRYHQVVYERSSIEYIWSAGPDGRFESDPDGGPSLKPSIDDVIDNLPDPPDQ